MWKRSALACFLAMVACAPIGEDGIAQRLAREGGVALVEDRYGEGRDVRVTVSRYCHNILTKRWTLSTHISWRDKARNDLHYWVEGSLVFEVGKGVISWEPNSCSNHAREQWGCSGSEKTED
jgi:hypothetical protein